MNQKYDIKIVGIRLSSVNTVMRLLQRRAIGVNNPQLTDAK